MLLFQKVKTKIINNKKIVILIILLTIILGIFTFITIRDNQKLKEEEKLITSFFDLDKDVPQDTNDNHYQFEADKQDIEQYVGVLQIPSISLQRGFYDKSSLKNTVDIGLEIINGSQMPNVENSELVIAGHSGIGYLAFFKELNKVEKGSLIYVYYERIKYTYKLEETTITDKNGEIKVEKDANSQTLILTTCNPNNRDKEQLILISKLIKKEKYRNGE